MKYHSCNHLNDFEFHDALLQLEYSGEDSLVLSAKELNVRQSAAQNTQDCDMEIMRAVIAFEGFALAFYEPGQVWETDAQGESHPVGEPIHLEGQPAVDAFLNQLRSGTTVISIWQNDNGSWAMGCVGEEPYFEVCFRFRNVAIEWDEFKGPAWYVLHARGVQA